MKKFIVGKIYTTNFVGDSNLWITFKIVKRTEKTVILEDIRTKEKCRECITIKQIINESTTYCK